MIVSNKKSHSASIVQRVAKQIIATYLLQATYFVSIALFMSFLLRTLTHEDYGLFSLIYNLIPFISSLTLFEVFSFVSKKTIGIENKQTKNIFSTSLIVVMTLTIIAVVLIWAAQYLFNFVSPEKINTLLLGSIILILTNLAMLLNNSVYVNKNLILYPFLQFLLKTFWVYAAFGVFILFGEANVELLLTVWAVGVLCTLFVSILAADYSLFLPFKVKKNIIKQMLLFSSPLVIYVLGSGLIINADKIIITYFLGLDALSYYALSYFILNMAVLLIGIPLNISYAYIVEAYNKQNILLAERLANTYLKFAIILSALIIFVLLFNGDAYISLIGGLKYLRSVDIITLIIPLLILIVPTNLLIYNHIVQGNTKRIAVAHLTAAGASLASSYLLIPIFSYTGAVLATAISYSILLFMLSKTNKIKLSIQFIHLLKIAILAAAASVTLFYMNPQELITKIVYGGLCAMFYFFLILKLNILDHSEKEILSKLKVPIF